MWLPLEGKIVGAPTRVLDTFVRATLARVTHVRIHLSVNKDARVGQCLGDHLSR